jgi:hypothetical protein
MRIIVQSASNERKQQKEDLVDVVHVVRPRSVIRLCDGRSREVDVGRQVHVKGFDGFNSTLVDGNAGLMTVERSTNHEREALEVERVPLDLDAHGSDISHSVVTWKIWVRQKNGARKKLHRHVQVVADATRATELAKVGNSFRETRC